MKIKSIKNLIMLFVVIFFCVNIQSETFSATIIRDNSISRNGTWKYINDDWQYVYDNGKVANDEFINWNGNLYKTNNRGYLMHGWVNDINGDTYFFNGDKDKGEALRGVVRLDNFYFYFDTNYKLVKSGNDNKLLRLNDTNYYVDNIGLIYKKEGLSYVAVVKNELEEALGKTMDTETLQSIKFIHENEILNAEKYASTPLPKDSADWIFNCTFRRDRNSKDVLNGDVLVMGDSNAYRLADFSKYSFPYLVHAGYGASEIKNELLDFLQERYYKYVFFYIGANDFMRQTKPSLFKEDLQIIIEEIKRKGSIPIMTTYFDIDYNIRPECRDYLYKINEYSNIVKQTAIDEKVYYLDLDEVLLKYGREEKDFIHPAFDANDYIAEKLMNYINVNS